jgi:hypothetical protein
VEVLVGGLFCVEDMSLTGLSWSLRVPSVEGGLAVFAELVC